ncbi:MAG: hypothetical protein J6B87_06560 [Clostridia bacterium]|nr:hypothetical protein [Clostridia bacterium]
MLEFWRNGERIAIEAIGYTGKVGQLVVYAKYFNCPEPTERHPLSMYPCPSIFTIVELGESPYWTKVYTLSDSKGNRVHLPIQEGSYIFDAQEWLTWNAMREKEKFSRKQRKVEQLEGHVDLLKDILIKQGVRVVTEEQASALNIEGLSVDSKS